MRKFLVNIHRFYYYRYPNSFDSPIMPCLVAALTITSLWGSIDIVFNEAKFFLYLKAIHDLMVTAPLYILLIFFYIYYWFSSFPTQNELKQTRRNIYIGVIICGISVILLLISSIFFL